MTTYNETDAIVHATLKELGIKYSVQYSHFDQKRNQDSFRVSFTKPKAGAYDLTTDLIDFHTGTGHRLNSSAYNTTSAIRKANAQTVGLELPKLKQTDNLRGLTGRYKIVDQPRWQYIPMPSSASVLYCLLSDRDCGNYTFDDFCDNLGCDNDSISAHDVYFACQKLGKQLEQVFSYQELENLSELLQDY